MTKHLFILGMACACLLVGLAGCASTDEPPPKHAKEQPELEVPKPPCETTVSAQ